MVRRRGVARAVEDGFAAVARAVAVARGVGVGDAAGARIDRRAPSDGKVSNGTVLVPSSGVVT